MNIYFCWLFHKWSKWVTYGYARDADFWSPIEYQRKTCERCGITKLRSVS